MSIAQNIYLSIPPSTLGGLPKIYIFGNEYYLLPILPRNELLSAQTEKKIWKLREASYNTYVTTVLHWGASSEIKR